MLLTFPVHCEDWSAAQNEVWKMQKAVWELWKKGEGETHLALHHKDMTLWHYNSTFTAGKDRMKMSLNYNPQIPSYELDPQEVKVFNSFAIVWYSLKYATMAKDCNERVMTTGLKQNEKWHIIGSIRAQQPNKF